MDKYKFKIYCAEIMGWELDIEGRYMNGIQFVIYAYKYNPYNDLNQRKEVFDKLYQQPQSTLIFNKFFDDLDNKDLDRATRNFIISVMGEK